MSLFDSVREIVENLYSTSKEPVPFSAISAEIGKYRRIVRPSSLTIAAHCNPRLKRIARDSFVPNDVAEEDADARLTAEQLDNILQDFERRIVAPRANSDTKCENAPGSRVPEDTLNPSNVGRETLLDILKTEGLEFIDKRTLRGNLWVIGGPELTPLLERLSNDGMRFVYKPTGGRVTKHRSAWWIK